MSTAHFDRPFVEKLMFGTGRARRFTQDSPVLPDVWLAYAGAMEEDNVLRSERGALELLLTPYRDAPPGVVRNELLARLPKKSARVIYNQTTVMTDLHFEELVKAVLPMTKWWSRLGDIAMLQDPKVQQRVAKAARDPENPESQFTAKELADKITKNVVALPPDAFWLVRVVGGLALARRGDAIPNLFEGSSVDDDWLAIVEAVAELVKDHAPAPEKPLVYVASLNRAAWTSVQESRLAIKADAAKQLFNISCKDIRWAVLDGGIDARHPAFRADPASKKPWSANTRILGTYDFSLYADLVGGRYSPRIEKLRKADKETRDRIARLTKMLAAGDTIDWKVIGPLLQVPHDDADYQAPRFDHGTHVAGILGANWPEKEMTGVCPDIRLYDLRVLTPQGVGEFALISAMQFLQWMNSTHGHKEVHGANISASIRHDVSNYACGRTPVCDEAERLVSSGVVVVAAAGNYGHRRYATPEGTAVEAYNTVSIVDPGNAEAVITVGATHRARPHTYGVSYFSSRGPTGDGRQKPDLVAPGEKITAPVRDDAFGIKDGTSMAAPHVSGAAALLMARHQELIGNPARVKQVLCQTATDLGREKYFQGHGMLDVLRALQAV
jgi:subtilisin family serine protease